MIPTWRVTALLLALLWLFIRNVPLTARAMLGEFLIGLAIGLPLAFATRRLYGDTVSGRRMVRVIPAVSKFVGLFVRDVVKANLGVAYRVLAPWMWVEPAVIVLPLRVESDLAVTTIANSITLTPGTLTLEHDEEHNALLIHAIDGRDRESVVAPIRRWEDLALTIFDEEGDPADPPPERPYEGVGPDG